MKIALIGVALAVLVLLSAAACPINSSNRHGNCYAEDGSPCNFSPTPTPS